MSKYNSWDEYYSYHLTAFPTLDAYHYTFVEYWIPILRQRVRNQPNDRGNTWREREHCRLMNGEYPEIPPPVMIAMTEAGFNPPFDHFLHVSKERPGMVAFTENNRMGEQDRQTRLKFGKYLSRHSNLSPPTIAKLSAILRGETSEYQLHMATTADDIVDVYLRSPSSCMSKRVSAYNTEGIHPVSVYGFGDVGLAYSMRDGRVTARALVNLAKKQYVRIYGDSEILEPLLEDSGYTSGSLIGCKLERIDLDSGDYVCPYLDGMGGIEIRADYLLIAESGDSAEQVDGTLYGESCTCDECGDRANNEEMHYTINEQHICEYCAGNSYVYWNYDFYPLDDLATYDLIEIDGEIYHLHDDDIVYCEDTEEYCLLDDAVGYQDACGDYYYQSNDDGLAYDEITGCFVLQSDSTEYQANGKTRYTIGDPSDDPDYEKTEAA